MRHAKKTWPGRRERQRIIALTFGRQAFSRACQALRGHPVADDDLADAFAAAWTAARILAGAAERLPAARRLDRKGLPMHIWA
jgi:predicted RNase H-like nuclease